MNDWIFHDYAAKTLIEKKEILGQSGRRKGFAISSESKGKETERESGKDKNRVGLEWSRGGGGGDHLWRLSVTLCLKPEGGLTCHSASSFCSRLHAILLSTCTNTHTHTQTAQREREKKPPKQITANRGVGEMGSGWDEGREEGVRVRVWYLAGRGGGARHGAGAGAGRLLGMAEEGGREGGKGVRAWDTRRRGEEGLRPPHRVQLFSFSKSAVLPSSIPK